MNIMKRLFLLLAVIVSSTAFFSVSARKSEVLSYGTPESVGMNGEYLSRTLDSIANASIQSKCFRYKRRCCLHREQG